jgi:hypothetical protein
MARGLGDRSTELLDGFVAAWARGETPDPRETLEAAPPEERDALAAAMDRVLVAAPAREPSPLNRAFVAEVRRRVETAEPPLLAARVASGLKRAQVVRALTERLGLAKSEEKVALRYHELETGQLDSRRVDAKVWSVLGDVLGPAAVKLARGWQRPPARASGAFYRADMARPSPSLLDLSEAREPADEVDRLFGVG